MGPHRLLRASGQGGLEAERADQVRAVGRRGDLVEPGARRGQAPLDVEAHGDLLVVLRRVEAGEVLDGLVGLTSVALDLGVDARRVPGRGTPGSTGSTPARSARSA